MGGAGSVTRYSTLCEYVKCLSFWVTIHFLYLRESLKFYKVNMYAFRYLNNLNSKGKNIILLKKRKGKSWNQRKIILEWLHLSSQVLGHTRPLIWIENNSLMTINNKSNLINEKSYMYICVLFFLLQLIGLFEMIVTYV